MARIFDARSLEQVAAFPDAPRSGYFARTGDGLQVLIGASGDQGMTLIVRQAPDWTIRRTLRLRDYFPDRYAGWAASSIIPEGPYNLRLSPNGRLLVASTSSNILLFDLAEEHPAAPRVYTGRSNVIRAGFDESGGSIVAGMEDGTITVLGLPDLVPELKLSNGARVLATAIRRDLGLITVADDRQRISLYETGDRPWLARLPAAPVTHQSVAVAPDGAVAWGDDRGDLHIRAAAEPHAVITVRAHEKALTSVEFSPDGAEILTTSFDGAIHGWRRDGARTRTVATGLPNIWSARYSPDGLTIAVGDRGGVVHLWKSGEPPRTLDCELLRIPMIAFSSDGASLACASVGPRGPAVWNLATGALRFRLPGQGGYARAIAYSPDGRSIVTGGDDRTVRVWNAADGALLHTIEGLPWGPFDLKFHPSGRVLYAAGRGPQLLILDPNAGTQLASLNVHDDIIFSIAVRADGRYLFTSGQDPWLGIIDLDRLGGYIRGNADFWKEELRAPGAAARPDATAPKAN